MATLHDRMKGYEAVSGRKLTRKTPVIIRVDGRAFHTFTREMTTPFDSAFMNRMDMAAEDTAAEMQGFKFGYVQSDEASFLLTDTDAPETEPWFGNDHSKMVSIAASTFTAFFARYFVPPFATFDARAFNVPAGEVANYFLWRARDWARNSLQMYARSYFSEKQLHGKGREDIHEMLHQKGANWATDIPPRARNGYFFTAEPGLVKSVLPKYAEISALVNPLLGLEVADVETEKHP